MKSAVVSVRVESIDERGDALVIAQVALALVLLVSSGLMIRTFRALMHVQPGFTAPDQLQTFEVSIPPAEISNDEQVVRTEQAIVEKLQAIPGVHSVGFSGSIPMAERLPFGLLFVQTESQVPGQIPPARGLNFVSPGFLKTLGTPLVSGRDLSWADIYKNLRVVLVSENLARDYWQNPADALA